MPHCFPNMNRNKKCSTRIEDLACQNQTQKYFSPRQRQYYGMQSRIVVLRFKTLAPCVILIALICSSGIESKATSIGNLQGKTGNSIPLSSLLFDRHSSEFFKHMYSISSIICCEMKLLSATSSHRKGHRHSGILI